MSLKFLEQLGEFKILKCE